jgi:hypothetical protein
MANGSWEEAKVCPRCKMTGDIAKNETRRVRSRDGRGQRIFGVTEGAQLYTIYCRNSRCRWFNTPWEVQVNPDGTIPDPNERRPRQFSKPDAALAEQVRQRALAIQDMSTRSGGGEVRGR